MIRTWTAHDARGRVIARHVGSLVWFAGWLVRRGYWRRVLSIRGV